VSGADPKTTPQILALAQVDATLALAKEQHLANLITLLQLPLGALDLRDPKSVKTPGSQERAERMNAIRCEIREQLGL
jgi:hypothetical protein